MADGRIIRLMRRLDELAALIQRERETLLSRWREQVRKLPSAQGLDTPTLNDHVPALLDELSAALRNVADQSIAQAVLGGSSPAHGMDREVAQQFIYSELQRSLKDDNANVAANVRRD